jgi:hypothetical protein
VVVPCGRFGSNVDGSDAVSNDRNKSSTPRRTADDTALYYARGIKGYETTFRKALYNPNLWLKTAEAVARWLKYCADNAHTRAVETKH